MVVMPFASDISWPKLIDRQIAVMKVHAFTMAVFSATMSVVVISSHTDRPDSGASKKSRCKRMASDEVEGRVPKRPIERKVQRRKERMAKRAPLLVLRVTVGAYSRMANQFAELTIILFRQVLCDGLMVNVRKKTVKPTRVRVVWIAWLFRKLVMHVVRDDVNFFGNDFDDEVSADLTNQRIPKLKRPMSRVAVKPEGSMASQNDHAVDKS